MIVTSSSGSASEDALTVVLPAVDVDVVAVWEESTTAAAAAAGESEVEGGGETAATGPAAAVGKAVDQGGEAAATGVAAAAEALQPELAPHASPHHLSKPLLAP